MEYYKFKVIFDWSQNIYLIETQIIQKVQQMQKIYKKSPLAGQLNENTSRIQTFVYQSKKTSHLNFLRATNLSTQENKQSTQWCEQYLMIGPEDTIHWPAIKAQFQSIQKNYSKETIIRFIQKNNQKLGIQNCRNLKKIDKDSFWCHTIPTMIQSVLKNSHRISRAIFVLNEGTLSLLHVNKYHIFLILSHMFFGTLPLQSFTSDVSVGKIMCINQDQDELTSKEIIQSRMHKLKSLLTYFITILKKQNIEQTNQQIVFEKSFNHGYNEIIQNFNTTTLTKSIKIKKGKVIDFQQNYKVLTYTNEKIGEHIFEDECFQNVESYFFTHPELIALKVFCYPFGQNETLVVKGAERFVKVMCKEGKFQLLSRNQDKGSINSDGVRENILIFLPVQCYVKKFAKAQYTELMLKKFIKTAILGYHGCHFLCRDERKICSGAWCQRFNRDWQLGLLCQWIAATIAQVGYVYLIKQNQDEQKVQQLKIMIEELQNLTIEEIITIVHQYYKFKYEQKGQIKLFEYIRDFCF